MMDPFGDMDDMINRLPSVVNNPMRAFVPALDMYETDKAVVIETPLAGVKPENVQVSVQKGVLTLRGETKNEHEVEEKNYYRKEVRSGSFFREVPLPAPVLEDKVTAEFEDGILRVTAPKAKATDAKKIDVKVVKKDKK
jgi:HSP20 family protein